MKSFGAKVHDMLSNSFFINRGYMGNYVKSEINSLIEYLTTENQNKDWDQPKAFSFINIIDEPMIKDDLQELYNKKFLKNKNDIDREIEKLNELRSKLEG